MLGLLGLRIFEAPGADITDLREEHGHRGRARGRQRHPHRPGPAATGHRPAPDQPQVRPDPAESVAGRGWTAPRPTGSGGVAEAAGVRLPRMPPQMLRHTFVTTMLDAGVDLRDVQIAARHADPRTTTRYDRARQNLDRHPNYILAAYTASGT